MKVQCASTIIVVLALLIAHQVVVSPQGFLYKSFGVENPLEETTDEDSDNENELDKAFSTALQVSSYIQLPGIFSFSYQASKSELIKEIIPPPPKA